MLIGITVPCTCRYPISIEDQYAKILKLFLQGELAGSQQLSAKMAGHKQNPDWSQKFSLLEAESALWRGRSKDALDALQHDAIAASTTYPPPALLVQSLAISGVAHIQLNQFDTASQELSRAQSLCSSLEVETCGEMLRARGRLAAQRGIYKEADDLDEQSLVFARRWHRTWDESVALMNLGSDSTSEENLEDAVELLNQANRLAIQLNAGDVQVNTEGNLGWTYFNLGDSETALKLLEHAARQAVALGDTDGETTWLTRAGVVYESTGNYASAEAAYKAALKAATEINSIEGQLTSLETLTNLSIEAQRWPQAKTYIDSTQRILRSDSNRLDALQVTLAQAKIDAAQHQDQQAQALFRSVQDDAESQPSKRLEAQHELAKLYEAEHETQKAEQSYAMALNTFEASRNQLRQESSRLPFLAIANSLYDDYIHFLISQNQPEKALLIADQSRARTLTEGLDSAPNGHPPNASSHKLDPQSIARKADATLLFYWLSRTQSFLWTITPEKTTLFNLPRQRDLATQLDRYRTSLQGPDDPAHSSDQTASNLYNLLIAPTASLIVADKPVIILADGELNQLNFETLLAPGSNPKNTHPHYWIEDVTLESAPSLAMLGAAKPIRAAEPNLLMLGNPTFHDENFPDLPNAAGEMALIQEHFKAPNAAVFSRQQATPFTYLATGPEHYNYIHFVAHGAASRTDPLDSAIILSQPADAQSSYKLHAREIMQHPIGARLVTISSCYGTGTRFYTGEGLVGLSWAFLKAGAHNTIGAMWEASDDSTPHLMDTLYQGLQQGQSPAEALRNAKLKLLHSHSIYQKPFYWAPFQLYTRL